MFFLIFSPQAKRLQGFGIICTVLLKGYVACKCVAIAFNRVFNPFSLSFFIALMTHECSTLFPV